MIIDAPPPAVHVVSSTAYCQSGRTASGAFTRPGMVAENTLRLGTWIRVRRAVGGRHYFRVMDRIGHGSQLDFYMPSCGAAVAYGRRVARFRVVRGPGR